MMQLRVQLLLLCLASFISANGIDLSRLQAAIGRKSEQWNSSFSVGVYHKHTGSMIAFGASRQRPTTSNRFPVGSVTKPYTVSAVMQAYEKGKLDIDTPTRPYSGMPTRFCNDRMGRQC
jgi:CubicO group peptidase (beta-lactamase class C family)